MYAKFDGFGGVLEYRRPSGSDLLLNLSVLVGAPVGYLFF